MARKAMASTATDSKTRQESQEHISGRGWHGDPEGHAAAGRKGGRKVSQDRSHMAEIGRRGGSKVAQDRQHMAEIGKKGGESK
jgi:general stress protein YciG